MLGDTTEGAVVMAAVSAGLDPDAESGLTFLGLVGVADPPRLEVTAAAEACHRAGIAIILVTGDNGLTTEAVARRAGIIGPGPACFVTGAALATRFDCEGDIVTVVDHDRQSRHLLPGAFGGELVGGDGLHRPVLEAAGVEKAVALVPVSSCDSTNVTVTRVVHDVFHVPHVVGRIDDPGLEPERSFGDGETLLVPSPAPDYLAGRPVAELDAPGETQVVSVGRGGHSTIPSRTATPQSGDLGSFVVAAGSLGWLRSFLGGRWQQ